MNANDKARPGVIVRRGSAHGRGVFARRVLQAGDSVIDYKGVPIDWAQAAGRVAPDPAHPGRHFLLGLPDGRLIDGACHGNTGRWINHACEPNCAAEVRHGRIVIRALRTIRTGHEITLDYRLPDAACLTREARRRFACTCGAANCRGTLLVEPPVAVAGDGGGSAGAQRADGMAGPVGQGDAAPPGEPACIRVLECLGGNRIVVSWRQPARACYSEQIWAPRMAKAAGRCALSMMPFEAGAEVFAPTGMPHAINREARILAAAVRALAPEAVPQGGGFMLAAGELGRHGRAA
ncbi:MAG: hypothetical protein GAK40_01127 [Burkholderia plantarii]|nr:MAG: hypothetical protein GAK40_01127 [Burkholderia plantarii]